MTRVWVTRDEGPDGELCAALRAAGLEPVCEPVVERRVTADVRSIIASLTADDWLVLTSPFAIAAATDAGGPLDCRLAVVGEASRRAAQERGLKVDLISPDGTGAGLWAALSTRLSGVRTVCYPRSSAAEPPAELPGVTLVSPVLYETLPRRFAPHTAESVAAAAVTSPSAARALGGLAAPPRCASIGVTTSAALRAAGISPWIQSPSPSFASLANAIAETLNRPSPPDTTSPSPSRRR